MDEVYAFLFPYKVLDTEYKVTSNEHNKPPVNKQDLK
jgi:hypothetical protein